MSSLRPCLCFLIAWACVLFLLCVVELVFVVYICLLGLTRLFYVSVSLRLCFVLACACVFQLLQLQYTCLNFAASVTAASDHPKEARHEWRRRPI